MSRDNRRRRWYNNRPKGPRPEGQGQGQDQSAQAGQPAGQTPPAQGQNPNQGQRHPNQGGGQRNQNPHHGGNRQQGQGQNRNQQQNFNRDRDRNRMPVKPAEPALPPEPPVDVPPELLPEKTLASQANQGVIENPSNCVICEMPVRSYYTSIRHKSGEPAHFDCVLRELIKEYQPKLGKARRIYYIGGGNFALVKELYDKRGHFKSYEVIERITYEAKEK